jgi:hypothetical protein
VLPPKKHGNIPAVSTSFEVTHGNPSDEELAVVVSLLTGRGQFRAGNRSPGATVELGPPGDASDARIRTGCLVAIRTAPAVIDVSVIVPVFNKAPYLPELTGQPAAPDLRVVRRLARSMTDRPTALRTCATRSRQRTTASM